MQNSKIRDTIENNYLSVHENGSNKDSLKSEKTK
jgi:hypothetical protein